MAEKPIRTAEIQAQVNMDSINFVSNDRLQSVLAQTTATPEQVAQAVRINQEDRLRSLIFGLLIMALLSLLAIFPVGRLPNYLPGELPADNLVKKPLSKPSHQRQ